MHTFMRRRSMRGLRSFGEGCLGNGHCRTILDWIAKALRGAGGHPQSEGGRITKSSRHVLKWFGQGNGDNKSCLKGLGYTLCEAATTPHKDFREMSVPISPAVTSAAQAATMPHQDFRRGSGAAGAGAGGGCRTACWAGAAVGKLDIGGGAR